MWEVFWETVFIIRRNYWAEGYGTPRFLAQIYLTYSDGSEEIIASDLSWKASKSPLLMDMVYYGEHYDARLEQTGWCTPGFDDSKWEKCSAAKSTRRKTRSPHFANRQGSGRVETGSNRKKCTTETIK